MMVTSWRFKTFRIPEGVWIEDDLNDYSDEYPGSRESIKPFAAFVVEDGIVVIERRTVRL